MIEAERLYADALNLEWDHAKAFFELARRTRRVLAHPDLVERLQAVMGPDIKVQPCAWLDPGVAYAVDPEMQTKPWGKR